MMEENFPEVKGMSLCIEWDKHSAQRIGKTNYIKWLTFQNYPDSLAGEESEVKVSQLCLILCNPMDCSPWDSPDQTTGVGSHSLLQGIFPTQGSNPGFLHCGQILYQLNHQASPDREEKIILKRQ